MAGTLAVGQVLEVKIGCKNDRLQLGLNVLHYIVDTVGLNAITDLDVANFLLGKAATVLPACINNTAAFVGVKVQVIWPLPKWEFVQANDNVQGTAGPNPLPSQCSGIVRKNTGFAGRAKRGRIYVPFPASIDLGLDNRPVVGYVTRIQAYADVVHTLTNVTMGVRSGTIRPVLWGRVTHVSQFVTNNQAIQEFATQRRRGDYGATNPDPVF